MSLTHLPPLTLPCARARVVDFDSWDCELVERWFEWFPTFRPFMVQLEVAYWMVPPIKFSVLYSDDSYATFSANYKSLYAGCSLTLQEELMRRYGYVLVQMDYLDALYVKREALPFFQGAPAARMDSPFCAIASHLDPIDGARAAVSPERCVACGLSRARQI